MRAWTKLAAGAVVIAALAGGAVVYTSAAAVVAPNSIERSAVYQDKTLLARAWALPVARRYGPDGYVFQGNPSICGPTSIADVLHSEGITTNPRAVLRGTGVRNIFGILPGGLTLDQEARILETRAGQKVTILRGLTQDAFRAEMAKSNDPTYRIIVNFTREPLFGRGHGHFSPVLGYLAAEDLVFVGDVNAHYKPWLVPTQRLFEAQNTIDGGTHKNRGVLEVPVPQDIPIFIPLASSPSAPKSPD